MRRCTFHSVCLVFLGVVATPFLNTVAAAPSQDTTACLAMIMKNEGPILPRLFDSIRGFVSEYCVMDTGSTDNTVDVLESIDMPGQILHGPFVDFSQARNAMIGECREVMTSCDYFVLLDADMVLRVDPAWSWNTLDGKDVYNLVQISGVEYENVRIIRRTADRIRVVGATHEYYDVPSDYTRGLIPKELIYIDDVGDGKAKADKCERDVRLLRQDLDKDPDNPRAVFYLANTLRDMQRFADAIPLYKRRSQMNNGWWVERDYALYMLSRCYLGLDDLKNARKYGELAASTSNRAEPLYDLIYYLHHREQHALAWYYYTLASGIPKPPVDQALFIAVDIYGFWLDFERATLTRHAFPRQPMVALEAGLSFLNNLRAPQYLREYFYREEWGTYTVEPLPTEVAYHHYTGDAWSSWQCAGVRDGMNEKKGVCDDSFHDTDAKEVAKQRSLKENMFLPKQYPLFLASTEEEETLCIAQWYPLERGKVVEHACEVHSHPVAPRIFSFLNKTSDGAQYQGDTWFLARSYSTDQEGSTSRRVVYYLIALDARFRIKTYTMPFTLPQLDDTKYADMALLFWEDGEVAMIFTESTKGKEKISMVHRVSLLDLAPLLVSGPKT